MSGLLVKGLTTNKVVNIVTVVASIMTLVIFTAFDTYQ